MLLSLTVTCAWADAVTEAKTTLGKVVAMADLFGLDTSNAEALIADPDATFPDLYSEINSLGTATKEKANEAMDLGEAFFNKFDQTAIEHLTPYFAAAREALWGDDVDAMSTAIQVLAAQVFTQGQDAMGKVDAYLRMMDDATLNTDLTNFQTAVGSNNLKGAIAALKDMKSHVKNAGMSYLAQVQALINAGDEEEVSDMEKAKNTATSVALSYPSSATVIDLGAALLNLIKAVEEYKEKQAEVPTGINGITAEQMDNIYNLNGQRVQKAQKGLYIINGKKVLVK